MHSIESRTSVPDQVLNEQRREVHLNEFEKALDRVKKRGVVRIRSYFRVPEDNDLRQRFIDFVVYMADGTTAFFHISRRSKKKNQMHDDIHYCFIVDSFTKQVRPTSFVQTWIEKELSQIKTTRK